MDIHQVLEAIKKLVEAVNDNPERFSNWESDFIREQAVRVEKWGENIRLSDKQLAIIYGMARKLRIEEPA